MARGISNAKILEKIVTGKSYSWCKKPKKKKKKDMPWVLTCLVTQSCLTLYDPMDCSPLGSSVHRIVQARILKWVAMPSFRGSFWPRNWTQVSCISCIVIKINDSLLLSHRGSPLVLKLQMKEKQLDWKRKVALSGQGTDFSILFWVLYEIIRWF